MMEQWLRDFFDSQLTGWDLASKNYKKLSEIKTKPFKAGDLNGRVQYNPARAVSTLAKLDKDSIEKRACFLCKSARPLEQNGIEIIPGMELLINPYPILPYHFTIVSDSHKPQRLNKEAGETLATLLPGMIVFYNAPGAGASAPDHLHYQAVRYEDLPLIKLVDMNWVKIKDLNLPFEVYKDLHENESKYPLNAFFWKSEGEIRSLYIPRRTHRPKLFFMEFPERRAVSPGAIDMCGVLVTPYEEDFNNVTDLEICQIYKEVGFKDC